MGAHALRFFTEYFGIPYPADKLDLVAIPDFAFGAMENLGCVTFRESALLVDPAQAARVELERVADVVCHEIAHMWFGDLVTMKWWNGIWLNEAFATFMEVLAVDAFRPEWQRWVSFGVEREAAMAVDGLHATRPVEFPVGRPEEAEGMFDVLTYQKGGSVLRMLEQFLGPDVFREGINDYLTTHAYGNTETVDLWDALERSSGRPVRTIMDTWINQGGYPLVPGGRRTARSTQAAVLLLAGEPGGAIGSRWQVPVLTRALGPVTDRRPPARPAGRRPATAGTAAGVSGDTLVNAGGSGYYRVAYPTATVWPPGRPAGRPGPPGAVQPGVGHLGRLPGRPGPAGRPAAPGPGARRLGRGRPERVVGGPRGPRPVRPDRPRRRPAGAGRRPCAPCSGPLADDLGWDPRDDDDERTPSLRSAVLRTLGTIGDDPDDRGRGGPPVRPGRATEALHPDTESAVLDIVASDGGRRRVRGVPGPLPHPSTPQEEIRYLYALRRLRGPGPGRADLRPGHDRGAHPERALRPAVACVANRDHRAGHLERITAEWDDPGGQVPVQHPPPDARRRPGPVQPARAGRPGDRVHREPTRWPPGVGPSSRSSSGWRSTWPSASARAAGLAATLTEVLELPTADTRSADGAVAGPRPVPNLWPVQFGVIATVFVLIFVAELPDKTMIATLIMGSRYRPVLVWIGATAGLRHPRRRGRGRGPAAPAAPPPLDRGGHRPPLRRRGGLPPLRPREGAGGGGRARRRSPPRRSSRPSAAAFLVIFIGEFGDLTQILTANLAAKYHAPVAVFIGAFAALASVAALGAFGGRALLRVLPLGVIRKAGASCWPASPCTPWSSWSGARHEEPRPAAGWAPASTWAPPGSGRWRTQRGLGVASTMNW